MFHRAPGSTQNPSFVAPSKPVVPPSPHYPNPYGLFLVPPGAPPKDHLSTSPKANYPEAEDLTAVLGLAAAVLLMATQL